MAYATYPQRKMGRTPRAPARKMGTWKMAYADFLTALMAFFLLMWLVNGVTPEDRTALADYFNGEEAVAASVVQPSQDIVALARLIEADPALTAAGTSAQITTTPTHIRINLVDSGQRPLFATGDGSLSDEGESLVTAVGNAVSLFDFPIAIEGHTDAFPSALPDYSNWELSADRANAARRALLSAGVDSSRIIGVTGLAATQPLKPAEPHLSANRRISIVLDIRGQTATDSAS